jgi:ATP-binding cassette subfamily F protein uup
VGGYSDWLRQRPAAPAPSGAPKLTPQVAPTPAPPPAPATGKRKLGYKEQRELDQLPALIESLEAQVAEATARIASPELYREGTDKVLAANQALSGLQAKLDAAYARWNELD